VRLFLVVVMAGILIAGSARARTAEISLSVRGDQRMADELKELVETLDKESPLTGDGLSLLQGALARRSRVATALRSRGFYDAQLTTTFANQPIDAPEALDAISARPEEEKVSFSFAVETGPRYRVAALAIRPPGQPAASIAHPGRWQAGRRSRHHRHRAGDRGSAARARACVGGDARP
jgi:translocation and assembly module TamA